jgi:hypothetical protein
MSEALSKAAAAYNDWTSLCIFDEKTNVVHSTVEADKNELKWVSFCFVVVSGFDLFFPVGFFVGLLLMCVACCVCMHVCLCGCFVFVFLLE